MERLLRMRYRDSMAYLMILPFYLLFSVFVLVPIGINLLLSFTNYNMRSFSFIGIMNYVTVLKDPLFQLAFKNTAIYTVITVFATLLISFTMSLMLNRSGWFMRISRTVFYLPNVVSMIAVATIWRFMYNPYFGVFNAALAAMNLPVQTWLLDANMALGCIIVMSVWKTVGYNMVLFLAGLQGVPQELYESASIDGAHGWRMTWFITLPSLSPVTFFVIITCCINSFSVFDQVRVLTRGGPMDSTTTLVYQIYNRAFTEFRLGYASTMAIVLTGVVFMLTLLSFRFGNQQTDIC